MAYRDPDTGKFITLEQWQELQETGVEEFSEWDLDDPNEFDSLDEGEYEGEG